VVKEVESMRAKAIIGIRSASSQVAAGMAEILVFGTAVKISDAGFYTVKQK